MINYGVDPAIYNLGKNKSPYPHVFYLGRLKRFKGVHLLIEAMAKLSKKSLRPDYRLLEMAILSIGMISVS